MTARLTDAIDLAQTISTTTHHRSFVKAVRAFVAFLDTVPDAAPAEWSHDTLNLLRDFAEDVITAIEKRLSDGDQSEGELALEIYEIRRMLEEIMLWERRYLGEP